MHLSNQIPNKSLLFIICTNHENENFSLTHGLEKLHLKLNKYVTICFTLAFFPPLTRPYFFHRHTPAHTYVTFKTRVHPQALARDTHTHTDTRARAHTYVHALSFINQLSSSQIKSNRQVKYVFISGQVIYTHSTLSALTTFSCSYDTTRQLLFKCYRFSS